MTYRSYKNQADLQERVKADMAIPRTDGHDHVDVLIQCYAALVCQRDGLFDTLEQIREHLDNGRVDLARKLT